MALVILDAMRYDGDVNRFLFLFLVAISPLVVYAQAPPSAASLANPVCDSELGKAISDVRSRALKGETIGVHDALRVILEHAKRNSDLINSPNPNSVSPTWVSTIWGGRYLSDLKKLFKAGCVDSVTRVYFKKLANTITFSSPDDVILNKKRLNQFPSLAQYWINIEHYEKLRLKKFGSFEQDQAHQKIIKILPKAYQRKHPLLGKLSIREHLLLTMNRAEMNLLADPFNQTLDMMSASGGRITLDNPKVPGGTIEIELSPSDIYRLSINHFDIQLNHTVNQYFPRHTIRHGDSIVASYLTGNLDPESFSVVLTYADLKEPKKSWLRSLGKFAWQTAEIVLYQIPVTVPFITLGSLVYDSIQRNKAMERARADETHLIRR